MGFVKISGRPAFSYVAFPKTLGRVAPEKLKFKDIPPKRLTKNIPLQALRAIYQ